MCMFNSCLYRLEVQVDPPQVVIYVVIYIDGKICHIDEPILLPWPRDVHTLKAEAPYYTSPITIELPAGIHRIRLHREGFVDEVCRIQVSSAVPLVFHYCILPWPEQSNIISAPKSRSGIISVIDVNNHNILLQFSAGNQPTGLVISPSGTYLALSNFLDNTVELLRLRIFWEKVLLFILNQILSILLMWCMKWINLNKFLSKTA